MEHNRKQYKRILKALLKRSGMVKTKSMPLSKAIEGFLLSCQARRLSTHTIDDYRRTLAKFLKHTGDMPIHLVGTSQISAFLGAQTVGKKTLLNYHIGLSALWTWAIKEEYVEKHVVRMVDKPKPSKIVIQPFTETEIRALLQAIRYAPDRNRALILLLMDTGARASEVCGLQKGDIDLVNKRIKVRGKGDKERLIPFSSRTGSALFSYLATCEGKPFGFSRHSLAQYLRRLGKRAGVKNVHPHRFRHFFAISYLRFGGDPFTLQEILGHSTMDMVKRYIALAQVDLDTAHRKASPVENMKI
jgi:site-specific recombinase XerD